jgi:hypothetical protein
VTGRFRLFVEHRTPSRKKERKKIPFNLAMSQTLYFTLLISVRPSPPRPPHPTQPNPTPPHPTSRDQRSKPVGRFGLPLSRHLRNVITLLRCSVTVFLFFLSRFILFVRFILFYMRIKYESDTHSEEFMYFVPISHAHMDKTYNTNNT